MRRSSLATSVALCALALSHCECNDNLQKLPEKAIDVCAVGGACATVENPQIDVAMPAIEVGQTARASFVVKNVGQLAVTVTRVGRALNTQSSGDFRLDPQQIGGEIPKGGEIAFDIVYSPSDGGTDAAVFVVENDAPEKSVVRIRISSGANGARICPDPEQAALDFGNIDLHATTDRPLVLSSCGNLPLVITELLVEDTTGAHFEQLTPGTLPASLEPGTSLTVNLRFTANVVGPSTGKLTVRSNAAGVPEGIIPLTGRAAACQVSIAPQAITFAPTYQGVEARQDVLVINVSERSCSILNVVQVYGSAEFTLVPPPSAPPITLASGAVQALTFAYKPVDAGTDHATWRVTTTDSVTPEVDILLEGRDAGRPDCLLAVEPPTYNFGVVARNSTANATVAVRNVGQRACYLVQIQRGAGSSLDFTFSTPALGGLGLQPNAVMNVAVTFHPLQVGHRTATLEVHGGLTQSLFATGALEGTGSGPALCVTPPLLDFGIVPVGSTISRSISVANCGSDAVTVNSSTLTPSPSAFALDNPLNSVSIGPGEQPPFTVTYHPLAEGRSDGLVSFVDSSGDNPSVVLVGMAVNGPITCGNVMGRACAPNQTAWLGGATASITVGGTTYSTTTGADGRFDLTCVPAGDHTLTIQSGNFSTTTPVTVTTGQTATLAEPTCVDPGSARIAVVWGCWDSMETILSRLQVDYTQYVFASGNEGCTESSSQPGGPEASTLFQDPAQLMQYDIIFINCGANDGAAYDTTVQMNLRNFVAAGGSLFVSDWAYDYVNAIWPSAVNWHSGGGTAQGAGSAECDAHVDNASLRASLGVPSVHIKMCCTDTESLPATTEPMMTCTNSARATHPQMLMFQPAPNSGRVMYTTFHDAEQTDAAADLAFSWVIFQL